MAWLRALCWGSFHVLLVEELICGKTMNQMFDNIPVRHMRRRAAMHHGASCAHLAIA